MRPDARGSRWLQEGVLSGQCASCGAYLEQVDGADDVLARRSLRQAHPVAYHGPHAVEVPAGWLWQLSGPGAFSN